MQIFNISRGLLVALLVSARTVLLNDLSVRSYFLFSSLLFGVSVKAQDVESIARAAQNITVRVEGAAQGSGVIVSRSGDSYLVLTAWHVISGDKPGEEVDIITHDGISHPVRVADARRVGGSDLAVIRFSSSSDYPVARLAISDGASIGAPVFVAGYPLATNAVASRLFRFVSGRVATPLIVNHDQGYQLMYDNPTLPGMSGGAVLNSSGELIGIHGRAETDVRLSEQSGVAVKSGFNQGIYVSRFRESLAALGVVQSLPRDSLRAGQAYVAPAPAASSSQSPLAARNDDVTAYATAGAVAACDLAMRQRVSLTKSLPATSAMVAYILSTRHGSEIQGASSGKLNNEQLIKGSFIQIVGGIRRGCYDRLGADDRREINTIVSQIGESTSLPKLIPVGPASTDQVATYTTMGAVASCDLAVRQQVPLTKSLPATSAMVAYILSTRHGSEIQGVSNGKLNNEQLIQGSFIQIVGGIRRGCYDKLGATDKKEVDTIVSQVEKAAAADKKK